MNQLLILKMELQNIINYIFALRNKNMFSPRNKNENSYFNSKFSVDMILTTSVDSDIQQWNINNAASQSRSY